ncbi:DUF3006 domain-containing protein [Planococcus sp. YIM B11945]|uniref:DUF3006 domain-containing protein n=1 Tax=Planococcus sp. YIM B11945 TaxID=3435410 RepID=UPI003D7ED723
MKGMLDRIEDGAHAVIVMEEHGQEISVPVSQLPEGSHVHAWFSITIENETVVSILLDEKTTEEKSAYASSLRKRLRAKRSGSRFKRN